MASLPREFSALVYLHLDLLSLDLFPKAQALKSSFYTVFVGQNPDTGAAEFGLELIGDDAGFDMTDRPEVRERAIFAENGPSRLFIATGIVGADELPVHGRVIDGTHARPKRHFRREERLVCRKFVPVKKKRNINRIGYQNLLFMEYRILRNKRPGRF